MRRQGNVSRTFSPHVYPSQAVNGPLWLLVGQEQLCSLQVFIPHLLTPGGKGTCYLAYAKSMSSRIFHCSSAQARGGEFL